LKKREDQELVALHHSLLNLIAECTAKYSKISTTEEDDFLDGLLVQCDLLETMLMAELTEEMVEEIVEHEDDYIHGRALTLYHWVYDGHELPADYFTPPKRGELK
jgi:hypothetical protein